MKQTIFTILTICLLYIWGGYLMYETLEMIDRQMHYCSPDEIKAERKNYIKFSIFWVFTFPMVLTYLVLSLIERLSDKPIRNKETIVALLSGSLMVIVIAAIIWGITNG